MIAGKDEKGTALCHWVSRGESGSSIAVRAPWPFAHSGVGTLNRAGLGAAARPVSVRAGFLGVDCRRRTWSLTQTRNMGCLAFFSTSIMRSWRSSR